MKLTTILATQPVTRFIVNLSPYLLGALFIAPPFSSEFFPGYVASYLVLFAAGVSWALLRYAVYVEQIKLRSQSKKERRTTTRLRSLFEFSKIALPSFLILFAFQAFRERFDDQLMYIFLGVCVLSALGDAFAIRSRSALALISWLLYYTGICFLSFQIAMPSPAIEIVAVCLAYGCSLTAAAIALSAEHFQNITSKTKTKSNEQEGLLLLLFATPVLFSSLVYLGTLPDGYLLTLSALLVIYYLSPGKLKASMVQQIALLQFIILLALSLIYRF